MIHKLSSRLDGCKVYIGGVALMLTGFCMEMESSARDRGFSLEGWLILIAGWLVIAWRSTAQKVVDSKKSAHHS
jgi:hypothetical protein